MSWLQTLGKINGTPDNWAQASHVAIAYGVVLTAFCIGHRWPWTVLGLALLILVKEFWFDLREEPNESWQTSSKDCLFWFGGILLACGVIVLL